MGASGPISRDEWVELRRQARHSLPDILQGRALPDVLISYQQRLLTTTAANQVIVVEKSRRTGFTWAVAADAVLLSAAARPAGGMDSLYIGYNLDMAREFIDCCAMWAKAFIPAASAVEEFLFKDQDKDGERDIQAFRINFASGYQIVALASRPRSLRGRQGYVIIDEAAFHDDLDELLKAALALLIWGGKVLVISTHDGDTNPFAVLVEDIKKGRKPYALITLDFDQALHDGLYQRICLVTGKNWTPEAEGEWRDSIIAFYGDGADEELFCVPSSGSGSYLPGPLIERQQRPGIPMVRLERGNDFLLVSDHLRAAEIAEWCEAVLKPLLAGLDPRLQHFFGQDYARHGHLSVIWPMVLLPNMVRRPPFVVELRNIPYAQQRQVLWYIIQRLPRFTAGAIDSTGNGEPLAEETATKFGLGRIAQVKINESWYAAVMPPFKAAFEDGLVELPQDLDTYNDHRAIKLRRGVPLIDRETKSTAKGEDAGAAKAGKKRHGDGAIAHLLAHMASRLEVVEYDYTPAHGPSRPGADPDDDGGDDGGRVNFAQGAW